MIDPRETLIATARDMQAAGLNRGTAGNLSQREGDGFYITPTGMAYAGLTVDDIPWLAFDGALKGPSTSLRTGRRQPSSEWRFHRDLYLSRDDIGAVLHAHSPFAVSLACLRRDIPPFHYMIARFGGDSIRCADYALFGTAELSAAALTAMRERKGCLLANHGLLVTGRDLAEALALAVELEELCEQYWRACQLGDPVLLDAAEMAAVLEKFAGYGQQSGQPA
ncbi:MAG: class II aldolase/adducin family protein [Azonexus sp.]|jgi:L-fuculose-phosphate aldolase|nr:class II aldolase/adducin family protein [Azonexus sp.]